MFRLFRPGRPRVLAVSCYSVFVMPTLAIAAQGGEAVSAKSSIKNMEEVLVEAPAQTLADEIAAAAKIPGGVTVIDAEKLRQQSQLNMADILRYAPGVWAASTSGGQAIFFTSRGSNLDATDYDSNGIKLLQDGLPITTADGNNHNRAVDPLSAQSATVARGANAMSYGASTLGGAINFTTPTARDFAGVGVRLNSGSHEQASGRVTVAGVADSLDGLVTVERSSWGGYRQHNTEDRSGAYANAGWQVNDDLETRFYGTWLTNDIDLPGALTREQFEHDASQANPSNVSGNFQLNVDTFRIANRTTWQPSDDQRLEFGVSFEDQTLYHPIVDKVLVDFDGPGPMAPVEVFSLLIDTDHRNIGGMARYYRTLGDHELLVGVNYGRNAVDGGHYRNDGGERNGVTNLIDNSAETWEIVVQDQWRLSSQWVLTLAAQAVFAERQTSSTNVNSGSVTQPEGDYQAVNPRLGLVWNISENAAIYGNLSRLYEPPTNFELQDDERATNEPLDAMNGGVIEIGSRGNQTLGDGGRWLWDVSLYYAQIQEEILSRDDPFAPGTSLSYNVDDTVHAGIEALFSGEFAVGETGSFSLEPTLSLTLNHFRFEDDPQYGSNDLPAAPDYSVRGEMVVRHASGYYIGPVIDLVGDRWADFANTYRVDGFELLGLRGGYDSQNWRVFLEIQNLLDKDYVATHSVRDSADASAAILDPGAPLSAYGGLEFIF